MEGGTQAVKKVIFDTPEEYLTPLWEFCQ